MIKRFRLAAVLALGLASPAFAFDGWHTENVTTIPSRGSAWDYVTFDGGSNRLFIGHRKEGLQAYDIAGRRLVSVIGDTATASSNGATLMPEFDLGISNNENGTITPFRLSTLEARPSIKLGAELDTSHYDPATKRILVNMASDATGTDLVVLQAPSLNAVGTVRVASKKPEHSEADGKGNIFVATRDRNTVMRIDLREMKMTAEWPTPGCDQTNGLTYDARNERIFLGCRGSETTKPSFAVLDATNGKVMFTAEIGGGNDGVVFDPELKRIFLANGVSAVLNVFEQVDANTYKPVETLGTRSGVRALALDAKAKKLYSVGAEGSADAGKRILTSVSPFYANTFFPDTFSIYTFSR
jgi:hypothetical protein